MPTVLVLLVALAATALMPGAAVVRAQENGEYSRAVELGSAEFDDGNFAEARAQFTRAHHLFPNARTFRALGMVEFELKNYGDCIEYLTQALSSQSRPLEARQRKDTELLLARARGYVAHVSVDVEPDVATVLLDGMPVKLDEGRTLVVQVGDHVLEFRAPGHLAEKRLIKVSGGETRAMHVVLPTPETPAASGPQTAKTSSDPLTVPEKSRSDRVPLYKKPWLWIVVGAVVAGAAAGVAVALTRGKHHSGDADSNPPTLVAP